MIDYFKNRPISLLVTIVLIAFAIFLILNVTKVNGLRGSYYPNASWEGEPQLTRVDPKIDFRWFSTIDTSIFIDDIEYLRRDAELSLNPIVIDDFEGGELSKQWRWKKQLSKLRIDESWAGKGKSSLHWVFYDDGKIPNEINLIAKDNLNMDMSEGGYLTFRLKADDRWEKPFRVQLVTNNKEASYVNLGRKIGLPIFFDNIRFISQNPEKPPLIVDDFEGELSPDWKYREGLGELSIAEIWPGDGRHSLRWIFYNDGYPPNEWNSVEKHDLGLDLTDYDYLRFEMRKDSEFRSPLRIELGRGSDELGDMEEGKAQPLSINETLIGMQDPYISPEGKATLFFEAKAGTPIYVDAIELVKEDGISKLVLDDFEGDSIPESWSWNESSEVTVSKEWTKDGKHSLKWMFYNDGVQPDKWNVLQRDFVESPLPSSLEAPEYKYLKLTLKFSSLFRLSPRIALADDKGEHTALIYNYAKPDPRREVGEIEVLISLKDFNLDLSRLKYIQIYARENDWKEEISPEERIYVSVPLKDFSGIRDWEDIEYLRIYAREDDWGDVQDIIEVYNPFDMKSLREIERDPFSIVITPLISMDISSQIGEAQALIPLSSFTDIKDFSKVESFQIYAREEDWDTRDKLSEQPNIVKPLRHFPFSAEWRGYLLVPEDGEYIFKADPKGGVNFYLDDQPIFETIEGESRETGTGKVKPLLSIVKLKKKFYKAYIKYSNSMGTSRLAISWHPPNDRRDYVIPTKYLFPSQAMMEREIKLRVPIYVLKLILNIVIFILLGIVTIYAYQKRYS